MLSHTICRRQIAIMPVMIMVAGVATRFFKGSAAEANSALAGRCAADWAKRSSPRFLEERSDAYTQMPAECAEHEF